MSSIQAEIRATRTQPGFVPAAQVPKRQLVELASKALVALEQFMSALTPPDPMPISRQSIAWAEAATKAEGGHRENPDAEPVQKLGRIEPRKNYTSTNPSRKGNPQCPECQDDMVLRQRRSNGSSFYGCINYPACNATVDAAKFSTGRGARAIMFAVLAISLVTGQAHAQSKMDTVMLAGAIAADAVTTQRDLAQGMREVNPIARVLVTRGIAGQAAASAIQFVAVVAIARTLDHHGHRKAARWLVRIVGASEAAYAVQNLIREGRRTP